MFVLYFIRKIYIRLADDIYLNTLLRIDSRYVVSFIML